MRRIIVELQLRPNADWSLVKCVLHEKLFDFL